MTQRRVLVVEDEPSVAQTLCQVLALPQGGEHYVESCNSGDAALGRLRQAHFDLLVTDLRMPDMTGLDLLEQVRHVSPTTRGILITAFGSPEIEQRAYQLAVAAYLTKPFSLRQFIETVRYALNLAPTAPRRLVAFSEHGLCAVQQRIESLRIDVRALGVMLLDQSGQLLTECGQHGDFDNTAFLALLGNAMAATNEVVRMLKDQQAFDLLFHEGRNYEIYAARINDQMLLAILLGRNENHSRVGMVWLYLRRAISEIRELLTKAMVVSGAPGHEDLRAAIDSALDEALNFELESPAGESTRPPRGEPAQQPDLAEGSLLSYEQAHALGLLDLGLPPTG